MMQAMQIRTAPIIVTLALLNLWPAAAQDRQRQEADPNQRPAARRTFKPLAMGTHYAVASMTPQATIGSQIAHVRV